MTPKILNVMHAIAKDTNKKDGHILVLYVPGNLSTMKVNFSVDYKVKRERMKMQSLFLKQHKT